MTNPGTERAGGVDQLVMRHVACPRPPVQRAILSVVERHMRDTWPGSEFRAGEVDSNPTEVAPLVREYRSDRPGGRKPRLAQQPR